MRTLSLQKRGHWSMYLDGKWYGLQLSPETTLPTGTVATLDVSVLQDRLLDPILGIKDVRTDKRIDFIGGLRGTKELERLVDEGKAAVAFSLFPTTVDELLMVSDANEIMPPKSTWFEPKLRDGLLIHTITNLEWKWITMRVLIADKFEQSGRDGLQALGCEISYQPDLKDDALVEAIKKEAPDVLVVRGTKVTEPMLDAGPVKLVVRAGAGYNTIDVAAASKRGIYVSNCPGKNSIAVAELAFALDPRARSTHRRQRRRVATRRVEQERVFESARIVWSHAWADRRRKNWSGDDSSRARVWHAGSCLEQEFDTGTRGAARRRVERIAQSGCERSGRRECSSRAESGNQKPARRRLFQRDAGRCLLHQHRARRSCRSAGARRRR